MSSLGNWGALVMAAEPGTQDKAIRAEAIFFGLFIGGIVRIVWAYLKGGSLIDAFGITLTGLGLAVLIYSSVFFKRFSKGS